jgi:hypothetical protein
MTLTKTVASCSDGLVEVVELTTEEIAIFEADQKAWNDAAPARAMADIRAERNAKLAASDWRGISDNTMSDEWKSYRSQLRDFPANVDLNNIVWPEEPK